MRRYLFGLLALLVLACAVLGGGYMYFMGFSPDRDAYPVRGIDVSNHQGLIDWRRVAADDVSFAIVKATEGGDWVDKSFARNIAAAKEAGLAVGAYHFFTFCRPGAEQAQNFIATVPSDPALLPPVVDIEFVGNCPAAAIERRVRSATGRFPRPGRSRLRQTGDRLSDRRGGRRLRRCDTGTEALGAFACRASRSRGLGLLAIPQQRQR